MNVDGHQLELVLHSHSCVQYFFRKLQSEKPVGSPLAYGISPSKPPRPKEEGDISASWDLHQGSPQESLNWKTHLHCRPRTVPSEVRLFSTQSGCQVPAPGVPSRAPPPLPFLPDSPACGSLLPPAPPTPHCPATLLC